MEEKKDLVLSQNQENGITVFASKEAFELGQRMAQVFATSSLVPKQYQNNIGNCMIALNMAHRMKSDPLMVMQNLVLVHNVPTFEAKFAIACFNATGKYTAIKYKVVGEAGKDDYGMQAYAIEKATGELVEGPTITIAMAKAEGWYAQNPKWKNIPDLMLRYRAASWFIRTTDPGVMMGFQTREEVEDVTDDYVEVAADAEIVAEAEQNANTEQIVVPEPAPAQEAAPANAPAPEAKAEEEAKEEEKKKKEAKPMGAVETPELFK
jgi:hypothetical protein